MSSDGDSVGARRDKGPAYQRIKDVLRAEIATGQHQAGSAFITQKALCRRFSVSTTTAVRVLNELAAEGLLIRRPGRGTFIPDVPVSGPRPTEDSRVTVACILHGLGASYVPDVLRGVQVVCGELGYRLLLTDTNESAELEERALRSALGDRVAGVLLYPVEGRAHAGILGELRRHKIPIVMIDRYRQDVVTDAVVVDNLDAGYQLTRRLIELGHRSIATLWSETDCSSVRDRLAGHLRALRDAHLPTRPELTVLQRYWPTTDDQRRDHLWRLLHLPEPPTVLLCANGYVLAAAAHDLVSLGVDVPDGIDIAGMDTAGPYDLLPLTVVSASLPAQELGREATLLLHKRIQSADPYRSSEHVVLPVRLNSRQSSAVHLRPAATAKTEPSQKAPDVDTLAR